MPCATVHTQTLPHLIRPPPTSPQTSLPCTHTPRSVFDAHVQVTRHRSRASRALRPVCLLIGGAGKNPAARWTRWSSLLLGGAGNRCGVLFALVLTPLLGAACAGQRGKLAELLPPHAVPSALQDHAGFTPLHFAACYGHVDCVQYLLDHRADIAAESLHGWTPLHVAARAGRAEVRTPAHPDPDTPPLTLTP